MYRKDQLVFYGNTGVCRVADVAPLPQQKDGRLYYTLIPLFSPFSETIHVSVSTRAFMRPVISAAEAKSYLDFAEQQVRSLSSPEYLAEKGTNCNFVLKHSTGHLPGNSEVDVPLSYADYYYVEALMRLKKLI